MCIALILFASLAHAAGDNQKWIDALNQGDLKKAYQMFMALAKQVSEDNNFVQFCT